MRRRNDRPSRIRTGVLTVALLAATTAGTASAGARDAGGDTIPLRPPLVRTLLLGGEETRDFGASITPDGRYVAFHTAQALVAADTNGLADVYLVDTSTGARQLLSRNLEGRAGNGPSVFPDVSADGRFVAFASGASDLVAGDVAAMCLPPGISSSPGPIRRYPCHQVYSLDRQTGAIEKLLDTAAAGHAQFAPAISGDGSTVVFETHDQVASTGGSGLHANRRVVTIVDRATGEISQVHPRPIPPPAESTGVPETWIDPLNPDVSHDGSSIVFASNAPRPPGEPGAPSAQSPPYDHARVYLYDRSDDRIRVVSRPPQGDANGAAFAPPKISADGNRVAFMSAASNLVPNDANSRPDIFVWDRRTDAVRRVSVTSAGGQAEHGVAWDHFSRVGMTLSPDGRFVSFTAPSALEEERANCPLGYSHPCASVFVHDVDARTTEEVTVASGGGQAHGDAWDYAMSEGGEHLVFAGNASNLLAGAETPAGWGLYLQRRGAPVRAQDLQVVGTGDSLRVEGWTRWPGVAAASADDPADDGSLSPAATGTELTGGEVVFRPERGDLAVVWRLRDSPSPPIDASDAVAGAHDPAPLVRMALDFSHAGRAYRIEGRWNPQDAATATGGMRFELLDCSSATCARVMWIEGALGATGVEALAALPLDAIGASAGDEIAAASLATRLDGEPVDDVALGTFEIPAPRGSLTLRAGPFSPPLAEGPVTVGGARFEGTVDVTGLRGEHVLDVELCVASGCRIERTPVALG